MSKPRPSVERLREVLAYDPATGKLTWRAIPSAMSRTAIGDEAGTKSQGYIRIKIDGVFVMAHCVIFAMVEGRWPENGVDHEDLDRCNNRWVNIREATRSQNNANRRAQRNNQIGLKGVTKLKGKFVAQIRFMGRKFWLGTYPTPAEAHAAYVAKAKEFYGEFARAA